MPADRGAAAADSGTEPEDRPHAGVGDTGAPELRLGAWEGPLDLLLELARAGKVDLAALSIADLAGQFGAALRAGVAQRRVPLHRLGDWLVMAAHLALLRSRLLLPADSGEREDAEREAAVLRRRLADRERARLLADWLERRPQLGRAVFARGAVEDPGTTDRTMPAVDIAALLRACLVVLEREHASGPYRPVPPALWRLPDALARLRRLLPATPGWAPLEDFLPAVAEDGPGLALRRRAALASTLLAGLEMEREGTASLSQATAFGAIVVAPAESHDAGSPPL